MTVKNLLKVLNYKPYLIIKTQAGTELFNSHSDNIHTIEHLLDYDVFKAICTDWQTIIIINVEV